MLPSVVVSQELTRFSSPPGHWRLCSVLVVEDHSTYRTMMDLQLQKLGLACQLVEDGQAALMALACGRFDLIISDCRMPRMDGYVLTRAIRRRERMLGLARVPIIALTGHLEPGTWQRCCEAGMDTCLSKPLPLGRLRDELERWLPARQALPPPERRLATWPTRATLMDAFGSAQMVNHMLDSLFAEARKDSAALTRARMTLDVGLTIDHLHRLVGSFAFLGVTDLEASGKGLIDDIRACGLVSNISRLEAFQEDLTACLAYMGTL